jgi:hypothetical protein
VRARGVVVRSGRTHKRHGSGAGGSGNARAVQWREQGQGVSVAMG